MSNGAHDFFQGHVNVMDKIAEGEGSFTWGVHGSADKRKAYAVNIPELIINNTKFNNVSVTATSSDESRVGSKLLQYGKTTLDYKNKRFYFEPYENIKPDEPSKRVWAIGPTVLNGKKVFLTSIKIKCQHTIDTITSQKGVFSAANIFSNHAVLKSKRSAIQYLEI